MKLDIQGATVVRLRADNPSPMTLTGTNSYVVGVDDTAWVIDPGPRDAGHIAELAQIARELGSPAGIALTHDHGDHSEGLQMLSEKLGGGVPVLRHGTDMPDAPVEPIHTPGHAADHLVFRLGDTIFSGDLLLGGSSTIIPPGGGTLIAYLDSLRAVAALAPSLILPGHGEAITDATSALTGQLEHRLAREAALLDAFEDGLRGREELLSKVWHDVPEALRLAAHVTMQSHLEKLDIEGRLPADFERDGRAGWHGVG
ncbi:MAG TPA: MBL fold metallo-hydrolase [Solirubrobacterales bacterium]|nr:MBL fold metallo-hydrolase [Solirubrobacterales bacterium]